MVDGLKATLQMYPTFDIHDLTEFDTGEKIFRLANLIFAPLSKHYRSSDELGITEQSAAELGDNLHSVLAELAEEEEAELIKYLDSRIRHWTEFWLDRVDFGQEPVDSVEGIADSLLSLDIVGPAIVSELDEEKILTQLEPGS